MKSNSSTSEPQVRAVYEPLQLTEKASRTASQRERASGWITQEERNNMTREALADVDAGRVIDHRAMQAWAESLKSD